MSARRAIKDKCTVSSEHGNHNRTSSRSPKGLREYDDNTDSSYMSSEKENLTDESNLSDKSFRGKDDGNHWLSITSISSITIVLLVCTYFWFGNHVFSPDKTTHSHEVNTKRDEFRKKISDLREKYRNQDEKLWDSFNSGITGIQTDSPQKPSVFLLLQKENYHTSECLVQELAESAMKFLSNPLEPIVIRGEYIKDNKDFMNDYGRFLEKYHDEIKRRNVMIIYNLHFFPPVIAQAFHNLCDEFNPLVKEAAYVFTLQVSGENESPSKVAERVLTSLWNNTLSQDKLDPLMIRITDRVLFVRPESNDVCS